MLSLALQWYYLVKNYPIVYKDYGAKKSQSSTERIESILKIKPQDPPKEYRHQEENTSISYTLCTKIEMGRTCFQDRKKNR